MANGDYPFSRLPRWICRGGHGAINVAVLATMISHGRPKVEGHSILYVSIRASAQTLADEIGCDRKSIFPALDYWREFGPRFGIELKTRSVIGRVSESEIRITWSGNGTGQHVDIRSKPYRKRNGPVPKTGRPPVPETVRKEEPYLKPRKEIEDGLSITRRPESVKDILERRLK